MILDDHCSTYDDQARADAFARVMRRLWGGAFCVGLLLGAGCALADDRCADARAIPGAAVFVGITGGPQDDMLVLAPHGNGAFRWCYWNSPSSSGDRGKLSVEGEEIGFSVQITEGPEIVHFDLPGAIATDMRGVPLERVESPDGEAREGLLWRGAA